MECNKEEAQRAKEVAERKFAEKDYNSAKKFAQKAQKIYPGLDFISLFITILDIYCHRETIVNGQPDWHGVLRVDPQTSTESICASYWNLSQDIQAVRTIVVGAEGAFQIVSEACCALCDTFWTMCSKCHYNFMYSNTGENMELECMKCGESFIAVPLASGNHPMNQKTMSWFGKNDEEFDLSVSLSVAASSENGVLKGCETAKKDDAKLSRSEIRGKLRHEARLEILRHLNG